MKNETNYGDFLRLIFLNFFICQNKKIAKKMSKIPKIFRMAKNGEQIK